MSKKMKSKSNKTSSGVMDLTTEGQENFVHYRVSCDCLSQECDCSIQMEYDEEFGDICINFYKDLHTEQKYWSDEVTSIWYDIKELNKILDISKKIYLELVPAWIKLIYKRFKFSIKILFTGHANFEGEFMLYGEKKINDFITALEEGREKVKNHYKENYETKKREKQQK